MITEIAVLHIRHQQSGAFEKAFNQAQTLIRTMAGYLDHELHKCMEAADKYLLIVRWKTLADHTVGFRSSAPYREWARLLHPFYDPFPVVEHYEKIY
jgi:heme-degrading monooxygenase HmoA